ncbi:MAG: leucyl aminopeptidase family protein [Desulfurococcales archaeon]|nr:leucyl aminopeptidase family protein [Desulfurococcales archaeon]
MLYTRPPTLERVEGDILSLGFKSIVVPVWQGPEGQPVLEDLAGQVDESIGGPLRNAVEAGGFKAGVGEVFKAYHGGSEIVFVGLGSSGAGNGERLENVRRAVGKAFKELAESREEVLLCTGNLGGEEALEAVIAAALGSYRLDAFRSKPRMRIRRIGVHGFQGDIELAGAIVEGVYLARDVANAPPNHLTPSRLAEAVRDLFSRLPNVDVEVFSYDRLVREGFGGIVNVGKGSSSKPRLIVIRYTGGEGDPIALVGKTVVFDTGGINLKTSPWITSMRSDKAGGAAVLGASWILAKTRSKTNFVALLPAVINAPSGESYLPSDVIRMWDGTMVEVGNTDAEGRLIIADAIAYAAKEIGAREIVDLATLTGAMVVALGPLIAGYFTRNDEDAAKLEEAARATGDRVWRMPLVDEYKKLLSKSSPLGDVGNVSTIRYGGAITAALFLERFTHGKPWIHLDIAGPGIGTDAGPTAPEYWPDGLAPGYGARLVYEYVRRKYG